MINWYFQLANKIITPHTIPLVLVSLDLTQDLTFSQIADRQTTQTTKGKHAHEVNNALLTKNAALWGVFVKEMSS